MPRFADYMRLVKFQHTIFAMPFALMAFAYAMWKYALAEVCPVPLWWCVPLVQVVLCMVFARNTAMGFNRWADRRIDAANPRTAGREIPAGVISPRRALTFVAVNALLFVACAATINRLTALLSPVALAVIMGYSYCKRFTWAAHLVLGLSLSIAPVGAYIALTGRFDWEPCVLALLVLAVFYGIYFAKMLAQKRRGIQTRQIGRRREKDIHTVEVLMSMATLGAPIAQLLSIAFGWSHLPANARFTGFCIGMLGDAVFLLSVLCMKDSWRAGIPDKDKTELVTTGIYAFSRNPAFLGFDLMYIGVLLLYGNLLTLGFSLFAMMMLHLQILQEERFLASTFGEPYREYCRRVFRYLGRRKEHKRSY